MTFHSLSYFLFLPVVFLLHHYLLRRERWIILLTGSILFYLALGTPYLLAALALVTAVTYGAGIAIHRTPGLAGKRLFFWGGVVANIFLLAGMKYVPFIAENLNLLIGTAWKPGGVLVSVGVSYYVFQAISYLANILLEIDEPERHPGYFALYLAFFPKLLQGPIERPGDLLPQLKQEYAFDYDNVRSGLLLFAWGLLKKVVVADRLALFVNQVYGNVDAYSGIPLIIATYLYAIQIYFDFSGYTDMALGSARIFNISLTQNFNKPYLATSVADFWRRWHISFSRWILDYIFRPLQLYWRNGKSLGTAGALLVTFLVSGIWHGAAWTFIAWGLLHGLYLAASVMYKPLQKKIHARLGIAGTRLARCWQTFVTFHLVCFSWIFFRAASLGDAVHVVENLFRNIPGQLRAVVGREGFRELVCLGQGTHNFFVAAVAVAALMLLDQAGKRLPLAQRPAPVRWLAYYAALTAILFYGVFDDTTKFIYFQF